VEICFAVLEFRKVVFVSLERGFKQRAQNIVNCVDVTILEFWCPLEEIEYCNFFFHYFVTLLVFNGF